MLATVAERSRGAIRRSTYPRPTGPGSRAGARSGLGGLRLLALAPALLAGCASWPPASAPIERVDAAGAYRYDSATSPHRRDDLLLMMSVSGGGSRAAALAHGVLQRLGAQTVIHGGRSHPLLEELDLLSGVSGGAIVAAYYGLDPQRYFDRFETAFLRRNVDRRLWLAMLNPFRLVQLASPRYSRGDLYAEVLDELLFEGATFAQLQAADRGPFVVLNATDLSVGSSFEFTQDRFDAICTNLASLPVARAVAASAAGPPMVAPLSLRNHAGRCGWRPPAWAAPPARAAATRAADGGIADEPAMASVSAWEAARLARLAEQLRAYQLGERYPWLKLIDGSISDDLGVHLLIDSLVLAEQDEPAGLPLRATAPRRVALIVVRAASDIGPRLAQRRRAPKDADTLSRAAQLSIDLHSDANELLLRQLLAARTKNRGAADDAEVYYIEVDPRRLADAGEREYLLTLPSRLQLQPEAVDRSIAAGSKLLQDNAEWRRLIRDLAADAAAAPH